MVEDEIKILLFKYFIEPCVNWQKFKTKLFHSPFVPWKMYSGPKKSFVNCLIAKLLCAAFHEQLCSSRNLTASVMIIKLYQGNYSPLSALADFA